MLWHTKFLYDFYVKSSSRYNLAHLLPSTPNPSIFLMFFNVKSSSRYSLVQILPTLFFDIFKCKPSSRYSRVHFLSITFADRGPQPRKQRPYLGDHGSHFTRESTGFCGRERFQAGIHVFPTCYTSQHFPTTSWWWWWWCGWHDGEDAGHDNRRNSEVF